MTREQQLEHLRCALLGTPPTILVDMLMSFLEKQPLNFLQELEPIPSLQGVRFDPYGKIINKP